MEIFPRQATPQRIVYTERLHLFTPNYTITPASHIWNDLEAHAATQVAMDGDPTARRNDCRDKAMEVQKWQHTLGRLGHRLIQIQGWKYECSVCLDSVKY